jgi:hypothetical protein
MTIEIEIPPPDNFSLDENSESESYTTICLFCHTRCQGICKEKRRREFLYKTQEINYYLSNITAVNLNRAYLVYSSLEYYTFENMQIQDYNLTKIFTGLLKFHKVYLSLNYSTNYNQFKRDIVTVIHDNLDPQFKMSSNMRCFKIK